MLLAILLILNVLLLTLLGWGLRKDEVEAQEKLQGWVAQPIPVKVSTVTIWRNALVEWFYEELDKRAYESDKYSPKHSYVHP